MAESGASATREAPPPPQPVPPPRGTTFLLSVYFALLALMWAAMLGGLISR